MNRILLILAIPILMTISVRAQSPLVSGTNEFTFDFYHTSILKTDGNVLISPLSMSMALGMIYPGAENNTAAEMKKTLHFLKNLDAQNLQYQDLVNSISGPKSPLIVTNMAWLNQGTKYKNDFLDIQKKYFQSSFREVDFRDEENTRKLINTTIEEQTRNKIHDLLPPGSITPLTRLVLTNALYFKNAWLKPFKPEQSAPGDFHTTPGNASKVMFMSSKGHYQAFENGEVKILELPYLQSGQGPIFSMLIILPKGDLQSFEENYFALENLETWGLSTMDMTNVKIPKFKIEHMTEVKPILQDLGMIKAFKEDAEFTGICENDQLFITDVFHKTFVEVNEQGTEAAAATAVGAAIRSGPPPKGEFIADKPFIFLIKEKSTNCIVMIGRIVQPPF
jgi:serine protease inhibitor